MNEGENIKKSSEKAIMGQFRKCFPGFPKGRLVGSESPDFILHLSAQQSVGIELTRFAVERRNHLRKEEEVNRHDLVEKAWHLFEERYGLSLLTSVIFTGESVSPVLYDDDPATRLADLVWLKIRDANLRAPAVLSIQDNHLPAMIDSVFCSYHPAVKYSKWSPAYRHDASSLTREAIARRIRDKEEKIALYKKKKLNGYWLIISVENPYTRNGTNCRNSLQNRPIKSEFNRIFLFEIFNHRILEIKQDD